MLLETLTQDLRRARVTNCTDSSFPSRVPTITEPSRAGASAAQATASAVFNLNVSGQSSQQNRIMVMPFGAGANNNTLSMRVIAWHKVFGRQAKDPELL